MLPRPLALIALVSCLALAADGGSPGFLRVPAGSIAWADGTPPFPPTVKVAVLEGDPRASGLFTLRVKFPAGTVLPLHSHPVDERSTVLSGTAYVGTSPTPDKAAGTRLEAGSFYFNPKDAPHWFLAETEVVLQLTTTGPWGAQKR